MAREMTTDSIAPVGRMKRKTSCPKRENGRKNAVDRENTENPASMKLGREARKNHLLDRSE